jgi:hypothetical protein
MHFASWKLPRFLAALLSCMAFQIVLSQARAAEEELITAVYSRASVDYVRTKLPDGSFQPETYTFNEGDHGSGMPDNSIDKLKFFDVAKTIAISLAAQNYLPTKESKKTKLMIVVYWGLAMAPPPVTDSPAFDSLQMAQTNLQLAMSMRDSSMIEMARDDIASAAKMIEDENKLRDRKNFENGKIMGYGEELRATEGMAQTPFQFRRKELMDELDQNRYFVVLMAYDFQLLWKEKKKKLLWETRFSISQHHNAFDKQLAAMAQNAARYFGQNSQGLLRKPVPNVRVDIGEVKSLGVVPEKH